MRTTGARGPTGLSVDKTGNVAAVQRQLGHKNAAYAMLDMRVSEEDLEAVLNDRAGGE